MGRTSSRWVPNHRSLEYISLECFGDIRGLGIRGIWAYQKNWVWSRTGGAQLTTKAMEKTFFK